MPELIWMFINDYTLKEIASSNAIKPSGCSFSRISEIRKLWLRGEISYTKIGTLNELKANSEEDVQYRYTNLLIDLIKNLAIIKKKDYPKDISLNDVKIAYRILCKTIHPDLNKHDPNARSKMTDLIKAYEYLKNRYP